MDYKIAVLPAEIQHQNRVKFHGPALQQALNANEHHLKASLENKNELRISWLKETVLLNLRYSHVLSLY